MSYRELAATLLQLGSLVGQQALAQDRPGPAPAPAVSKASTSTCVGRLCRSRGPTDRSRPPQRPQA